MDEIASAEEVVSHITEIATLNLHIYYSYQQLPTAAAASVSTENYVM